MKVVFTITSCEAETVLVSEGPLLVSDAIGH